MSSAPTEPAKPPDQILHALRGKSLARNTVWNLVGQVSPLVIAAFTIPPLIRRLGVERFGVLTLAWALVGYFSLFDLGLGRALTKVVSDRLASGRERGLPAAIWTAVLMMTAIGACFSIAICSSVNWIAASLLKVPPSLFHETVLALYPLGASIPLITITTAFRGVLEAQHRFAAVNGVRVFMGGFSFLGPLVASFFSTSLFVIICILVAGRFITCAAYLLLCKSTVNDLWSQFAWDSRVTSELLSLGGWITVSNLVAPLMTYADRFLITYFLSVSVVAYYTTPFELVTKLWLIPGALGGVLFPAFAALVVIDQHKLEVTYGRGVRACFTLLYPAVMLLIIFAPEGLRVWLGPVFALKSTAVLRWLSVGVLFNSLAQIPYALLQAAHRPDVPGKLHLAEVPVYLAAAWWVIPRYGIAGAAAIWMLRLTAEALLLFYFAARALVPHAFSTGFVTLMLVSALPLPLLALNLPLLAKAGLTALLICGYAIVVWRIALAGHERSALLAWISTLSPARGD